MEQVRERADGVAAGRGARDSPAQLGADDARVERVDGEVGAARQAARQLVREQDVGQLRLRAAAWVAVVTELVP